ncbi:MAG: DUF488 domain-containing protein [Bordetella sp.]|uniref:DUF488 domain-containing protein n=1 Tax=Bordetella sp. TaxID=28081 RepID=UPI003F7BD006
MRNDTPDIRIKRVYDPPLDQDGARVLVDRLWPRGLSKQTAALTLWLKEVAPSSELRGEFCHDPRHWEEFRRRYFAELAGGDPAPLVQLAGLARRGPLTLLYAARDTEHNNAVVLAAYLSDHLKDIES